MTKYIEDPGKGWEIATTALAASGFLPSAGLLGYSDILRLQGNSLPEWASTFITPEFLISYGVGLTLFAASMGTRVLMLERRKKKIQDATMEYGLNERSLYRSQVALGVGALLIGAAFTGHSLLNHDATGSIFGAVTMLASDLFISPNIQASKAMTRVLRRATASGRSRSRHS